MDGRQPLGVGVRAPDFALTDASGTATRFYAIAGGQPTALALGRGPANPDLVARLAPRDDVALISVAQSAVAATFGVPDDRPTVMVLDPDLRVVGLVTGDHPADEVVALLEAAAHRAPPTEVTGSGPRTAHPAGRRRGAARPADPAAGATGQRRDRGRDVVQRRARRGARRAATRDAATTPSPTPT